MKEGKSEQEIRDPCLENKLSELEILRQSFEEKKKQAESYYDQLLRLKAEFENYRKRVEKERDELIRLGKEQIVERLLEILDSFELALSSVNEEKGTKESIKEGINLIYRHFRELLEKEGLKKLTSEGEKFDPNVHFAVEYEETTKDKDNLILREIRPGYTLCDRVIRPAMVVVGKSRENKESEGQSTKS